MLFLILLLGFRFWGVEFFFSADVCTDRCADNKAIDMGVICALLFMFLHAQNYLLGLQSLDLAFKGMQTLIK